MKLREVEPQYMEDQKKRWSPIERRCLSLLQQTKTRANLLQIHAFMLRSALDSNVNLLTKLITVCSSITISALPSDPFAGIRYARCVFDRSPHKDDAFLCGSMIRAHVGMRQFAESVALYRDLKRDAGYVPDNFTLPSLAKSCGLSMAVWEGQEVHNHALKYGFCCDLFVATALVDMYAKFGRMVCARGVFDEMTERSRVSWTSLVSGYARGGDMGNARLVFDQIPERDTAAFNAVIDGYVKLRDMGCARNLFDEMPERDVVSWTTMIHGYCNIGDVDSARSLFDVMPDKNLFSWNAMISGCSQNKKSLEALKLFHDMQSNTPFEPDEVTIASVLPAVADLGVLDLGNWVHWFVQRKKLDKSTNVCTALVDMYAKCGEIGKARNVFNRMPQKETSAWNALINGFAINGLPEEALEAFLEMIRRGSKPNEVTMISVLSACNHSGRVEEGRKWFKAIKGFGFSPKIEHYGCMIDLLGRAGCLEEAEKLIESMPYEVNGIILSSVLCACGYAKDVSRAERLIKKAIEMEPWNDGNYVILRNLYATERRWKDVERIKGMMQINGSKKEVGCSTIEVDGRICEFIAGKRITYAVGLVLGQLRMHMKREDTY